MKKTMLWIAVLLLMWTSAACAEAKPDFRSVNWGMSMEEVIEREGKPTEIIEDALFYDKIKVAGIDVVLVLHFVQDRLVVAAYVSQEHYPMSYTRYIDDYNKLKDALISVYGSPEKDEVIWEQPAMKGIVDTTTALQLGDIRLESLWQTDKAYIQHELKHTGKIDFSGGDITHQAIYLSTEYMNLFGEQMKEEHTKGL